METKELAKPELKRQIGFFPKEYESEKEAHQLRERIDKIRAFAEIYAKRPEGSVLELYVLLKIIEMCKADQSSK